MKNIISYFKNRQVETEKKHLKEQTDQVFLHLKQVLEERKLKRSHTSNDNTFTRVFYSNSRNGVIVMDAYTKNNHIYYCVSLLTKFPVEKTQELMLLAMNLNNVINRGIVRIQTEENWIYYEFGVPLEYYFHNMNMVGKHWDDILYIGEDMQALFEKQLTSDEDPLFNFASFYQEKKQD